MKQSLWSEWKCLAAYPAQTHVIAAFLQLQKLQELFHSLKHKHAHGYKCESQYTAYLSMP